MGEDVNAVSPTLGFIIKTIDYEGYVATHRHTYAITGVGQLTGWNQWGF